MKTRMPPGDYDDYGNDVFTANLHGNSGSAGYVSSDNRADTTVQKLREVVAEVTRGRIPAPTRRGPGFY